MYIWTLGSRSLGSRTLRDSGQYVVVHLGKASRLCERPPNAAPFMEAGFPKVNHRKLLGFPKGPGTQGPGTQKDCIWGSLMTLGFQDPNGILDVYT